MKISINSEVFQTFLERCMVSDSLIRDLVIQCDENGMHAMFGTLDHNLYGEVHCTDVIVDESGTLEIPQLGKLINIVKRTDSKSTLSIITKETPNGSEYLITDGIAVNKVSIILQQSGLEKPTSWKSINGKKALDTENKIFMGRVEFKNGCKLDVNILNEVVGDAKAFVYDAYKFGTKENKDKTKQFLNCSILNQHTTEKLTRVLATGNFMNFGDIPSIVLGRCFKEVISTIKSTTKKAEDDKSASGKELSIYLDEAGMLITDEKNFYYVIGTAEIN